MSYHLMNAYMTNLEFLKTLIKYHLNLENQGENENLINIENFYGY